LRQNSGRTFLEFVLEFKTLIAWFAEFQSVITAILMFDDDDGDGDDDFDWHYSRVARNIGK
jgi:hypothetical protein